MSIGPPETQAQRRMRQAMLAMVAIAAVVSFAMLLPGRNTGIDPAIPAAAEAAYADGMTRAGADPDGARVRFLESASILGNAMKEHETAALRYNRANALLRGGAIGEAIFEYRSAQRLAPTDERVAKNLAEARSKVSRPVSVPEPTVLERASRAWGLVGERARWLVALAIAWAALAIVIGADARWRPAALAALGASMLIGATVGADLVRRGDRSLAVVRTETVLRKGNGAGFEAVLAEPLPEGTECVRGEARPGWTSVRLGDGTSGWLATDAIITADG